MLLKDLYYGHLPLLRAVVQSETASFTRMVKPPQHWHGLIENGKLRNFWKLFNGYPPGIMKPQIHAKQTPIERVRMPALDCGFNRSTQHTHRAIAKFKTQ
jgi:hypothetical protein